jgi:tetratricopeptide (TPR) repeat protein
MESTNNELKNTAPGAATEEAGWKAEAQILFMQFKQDTTDLFLLQNLLEKATKAIKHQKSFDDPFCKELAAYAEPFAVTVAQQEIDRALKIDTLMTIGDFLAACKKFDAAHACYDRMVTLDPNWDMGYISKADAFRDAYDLDKAIEYYKKGIDVNPVRAGTYYNIALYQRLKGLYKDARQSFASFISFANSLSNYDKEFIATAGIWVRYLDKKMELFGEKYEY